MRQNKSLLILFLLSSLFLLSCSKKSDNKKEDKEEYPGFNTSKLRPEGALFKWPDGISVSSGETVKSEMDCDSEANTQRRNFGLGDEVTLCFTFMNNRDQPFTLEFPPGSVWVSKDGSVQNGILAKRMKIVIPAKQAYFGVVSLLCINLDRATSAGKTYESTPVLTKRPDLEEFFKLLENKKINFEEHGGRRYLNPDITPIIRAMEAIIEGRPKTQAFYDAINALPNV